MKASVYGTDIKTKPPSDVQVPSQVQVQEVGMGVSESSCVLHHGLVWPLLICSHTGAFTTLFCLSSFSKHSLPSQCHHHLVLPGSPSFPKQWQPLVGDHTLTSGCTGCSLELGQVAKPLVLERYLSELTAWHGGHYTCNTIWQSPAWPPTVPLQLKGKNNLICPCQLSSNTGASVTTCIIQRDTLKCPPVSSLAFE